MTVAYSHTMNCAAERAADEHLVLVAFPEVELLRVVDEAHDLQVGGLGIDLGRDGEQDDGQDAGALLARGLGDELLDPVRETDDVGAVADEAELVAPRVATGDRRCEHERGVVGAVDGHLEERGIRLVEELGEVDAGETGGHESERGERGVASADGRVGVEDGVAVGARRHIERRAGVGHDHDPLERVDAEVAERGFEGALGRIGLDGRAGLGRDDQDRLGQAAAFGVSVERGENLAGRGRIEDDEGHARRLRDDLRSERRAAHAGEHHARDALRDELRAQRLDLGDERTRDADRLDPAEPIGCLFLGGGAPERRVARGDAGCDQVGHEAGERRVDDRLDVPAQVDEKAHRAISSALRSAVVTVSCSSCHEAMNFSTPSSSSTWVTSSMSTPTAASWSNTPCASA